MQRCQGYLTCTFPEPGLIPWTTHGQDAFGSRMHKPGAGSLPPSWAGARGRRGAGPQRSPRGSHRGPDPGRPRGPAPGPCVWLSTASWPDASWAECIMNPNA